MKITAIRQITVPLQASISNAVVSFDDHTVSLVALITDIVRGGKPVCGLGFNSIGRYGQHGILAERMLPRLLAADPDTYLAEDGRLIDAEKFSRVAMTNEKPGGHGDRAGAVAALELAVWDLNAKLNDEPAAQTIARAFRRPAPAHAAPVYAAGGYYDSDGKSAGLKAELSSYRKQGFNAYKIKVGGAPLTDDLTRIETALSVCGSGEHLAVDANGRFDLDQALRYAEAMKPYRLRWFEEAGDPLDFRLNAALCEISPCPVATGENLFSAIDASNLVRYAGMRTGIDIFQMDAGLSYGLTEYARMLKTLEEAGHDRRQCFPHGGHLINLHIVLGLGLGGCEAYPGVFEPFGGYSPHCPVADGYVAASDAAGFGLEQKPELSHWLKKLLD